MLLHRSLQDLLTALKPNLESLGNCSRASGRSRKTSTSYKEQVPVVDHSAHVPRLSGFGLLGLTVDA